MNNAARTRGRKSGSLEFTSLNASRHPVGQRGGGHWCFDAAGEIQNEGTVISSVANGMWHSGLIDALMRDMLDRQSAAGARGASWEELGGSWLPDDATLRKIGESIPDTPDESFH